MIVKKRVLQDDNGLDEGDIERHGWTLIHGDISYCNTMFNPAIDKPILGAFDLAAFSEPGDESPAKKGFERTGTKPFMALDLMGNIDGPLQRIRKHDLESFIWCFAWICEGDRSQLRRQWNNVDCSFASGRKCNYWQYRFVRSKPPKSIKASDGCLWKPLCSVVCAWMVLRAKELSEEVLIPHEEFLKPFDIAFPRADEGKSWDWARFEFAVSTPSRP